MAWSTFAMASWLSIVEVIDLYICYLYSRHGSQSCRDEVSDASWERTAEGDGQESQASSLWVFCTQTIDRKRFSVNTKISCVRLPKSVVFIWPAIVSCMGWPYDVAETLTQDSMHELFNQTLSFMLIDTVLYHFQWPWLGVTRSGQSKTFWLHFVIFFKWMGWNLMRPWSNSSWTSWSYFWVRFLYSTEITAVLLTASENFNFDMRLDDDALILFELGMMIIIIIINLIHIVQFDTNGILTALYIVIMYIQMQYVHVWTYAKQSYKYTYTCLHINTYTVTCTNIHLPTY